QAGMGCSTLTRCLNLLESIAKRPTYLSLLQEYPLALEKVVHLVASSSWAADYLKRHPVLLDELLDPRLLEEEGQGTFSEALRHTLDDVEPDTERQMDLMREAHHAQVFRLLARDIAGQLTVERLSDHLSDLADLMVDTALTYAWRKIATRHREMPRFSVIAYGKLGGKELGYASDLDLVFLFEDEEADAAKTYSRLATRLNTWLSAQTPAGRLFETDLRLRPNGESGLIVASLASFRKYQFESAWVWEHQALTRARHCAGDATLGVAFEQIRGDVLTLRRDPEKLRADVLSMRQKMQESHATPVNERAVRFDLKHDPGGLVDVEFIVQYLVLSHAWQHPALLENKGNIALLKIAADCGLIPPDLSDTVRDAYREYRHLQHALRLQERVGQVDTGQVTQQIIAVRALWDRVFEPVHKPSP
ncbi:MAG: bifunctional [glutamate--ammonia ligase]-adenylyl-L-tyrosine phosphorylase/[glutamate--ammonia-ligase] adenylyltransferase, partial [Rhodocyclaceae bacterium]|nr:bifunctional [glutamate--ammonia ligase]-adenylyl-L-tyrosine phosphorylase/[glutamate--ammonia-ligase] adenylyltransferase [Rhodocyclaceae bacterium]